MGRSRRKEVTQCRGAWPRDVVWQARVCEGPGERPAAGVTLNQLSEGIVGYL
jgi:hypothetical protein